MDIYLWKPEEYQRLYNCSFYKIEEIPLEKRQHIFLGISFILLFFLFEFLYIPCLLAIRKHLEHSCYKIMFYMGINDILCLFICGLFTGIFGIYGAVFCSFPNLIYISGILGSVSWYIESVCAVMLAMNRCLGIASPSLAKHIFEGSKTWIWLCCPLFYGLMIGLPYKPVLFNGILFSWFYNPHIGYYFDDDFDTNYNCPIGDVNNEIFFIIYPAIYLIFVVFLMHKTHSLTGINNAIKSKMKIFLQVFLISSINVTTAFIYIYMQYFPINEYIIYMGTFGWLFVHGLKPVIYLALNNTIRKDLATIFGFANPNHVMVVGGGFGTRMAPAVNGTNLQMKQISSIEAKMTRIKKKSTFGT